MKLTTVLIALLAGMYASSASAHPISPIEQGFLTLCTDIVISDDQTFYIAKANCLGRVSGYVVGHEMSVQLNHMYIKNRQPTNQFAELPALWCVPTNTPDSATYNTVINWVTANQTEYQQLKSKFPNVNGAMVITAKALTGAYQCK